MATELSATDLSEWVGDDGRNETLVASCWETAITLVTNYVDPVNVPQEILDRATLEVGAELFHRKAAKNGIVQFATPDAPATRIARDPMVAAYPLLDPFVKPGIA